REWLWSRGDPRVATLPMYPAPGDGVCWGSWPEVPPMIATTPIPDSGRRLRPGGRTQASPSGFELTPTLLTMAKMTDEREPEAFDALVPRAIDGDEAAWEALGSRLERGARAMD